MAVWFSVRGLQRSVVYKAFAWFLVATLALPAIPAAPAQAAPASRVPAAPAPDARIEPPTAGEDPASGGEQLPPMVMGRAVSGDRVAGRGAYTRTVRNPDGTYTLTASQRPMHWKDAAGE